MNDEYIEKLEKKVEFFKKNFNTSKTTEELEQEFETWYEDFKTPNIKDVEEEIQRESQITLDYSQDEYDQMSYIGSGTFTINRVCTLKAFLNKMILKRFKLGGFASVKIFCEDGSCEIDSNGRIEKSQEFKNYEDKLISTSGKYSRQFGDYLTYRVYLYKE